METLFGGYYVSSINNLLCPYHSLSTTIASINNDIFIASAQKIAFYRVKIESQQNGLLKSSINTTNRMSISCVWVSLFNIIKNKLYVLVVKVTVIVEERYCHYHIPPPKPWNFLCRRLARGIPLTNTVSPASKHRNSNRVQELKKIERKKLLQLLHLTYMHKQIVKKYHNHPNLQ